ncbi:MAG: PLP-dependent aminotransferase family protein [Paracoccaceae bacterium]
MALSEHMFFLDPEATGSLQMQIRQIVASAILSGRFRVGEKLPSSRKLAAHLGISRITVTLAYQELMADGYIASSGRSGYFVADTAPSPQPRPRAGRRQGPPVAWERFVEERYSGARTVAKPLDWQKYRYPFIYGQADPGLFNHSAWRACAHRALGRRDFTSLTTDYAEADDPELVNFIARQTLPRRGIDARPEEILITMGAQNALWLVAEILLSRGTAAVIEEPGYPGLREILTHRKCRTVPLQVDDRGLPPKLIPEGTGLVFATPSHQAPTTVTMPMRRRHRLLRLAAERDFLIVEDDYEFEMSFLKPPTPALKSLDTGGRVIYIGSFSKSLFPGLRLGYLVGPENLIREARGLRSIVLRHIPGHIQRTTAYFLGLGHYDALVRRMREAFQKRREAMARAIDRYGLSPVHRSVFGGTSFWMEAPAGTDTADLAETLKRDGVLIEPGTAFFHGENPPRNFYRLAYSSIPAERIDAGVALIANACGV